MFVQWAEAQGIKLGYAVSEDLDRDPDLLSGVSLYLSVGHDEYWSLAMRDQVESFIEAGGNAAFFSGNTSFWQARFENDRKTLVSYKTNLEADPRYDAQSAPELSTMWSDPLVGRPENEMTGVSFTYGGYAHMNNAPKGTGGYQVWDPDHWVFDSLDISLGAGVGEEQNVQNGIDLYFSTFAKSVFVRLNIMRFAPASAKAIAHAFPKPFPAPVTRAILFFTSVFCKYINFAIFVVEY